MDHLPLFLRIRNRRAVVVGGGAVAARKAELLLKCGAQVLLVTTDDAWFGTTSGPYQHAQIAQLRAIETGRYVVRAAATGISGIIAPDGRWTEYAPLEVQTIVAGKIGPPVGSVFSHIGPNAMFAVISLLYIILVAFPWRQRVS